MVSAVFVRGAAVTAYAMIGLCIGFYVQHALTSRNELAFEAAARERVDAAVRARALHVKSLEERAGLA
jgi:hypothetical protein